ncbi:hypothetical protein C2845_PM01G33850 [Panicum miliaceum]|uniref:Uncharacterized protein n=1 Tax=Panicum miliaceum TaxID=4540 RepID=A0A3L6TMS7_PANMI|nr:hypothetical protein C2845_PM01G33850 [Panicum miliaceum]
MSWSRSSVYIARCCCEPVTLSFSSSTVRQERSAPREIYTNQAAPRPVPERRRRRRHERRRRARVQIAAVALVAELIVAVIVAAAWGGSGRRAAVHDGDVERALGADRVTTYERAAAGMLRRRRRGRRTAAPSACRSTPGATSWCGWCRRAGTSSTRSAASTAGSGRAGRARSAGAGCGRCRSARPCHRKTAATRWPFPSSRRSCCTSRAAATRTFIVGFHGLVRDPATADLVLECVDGPSLHGYRRQQLTAHAAPKYPWFAKVDALEPWRKEEVSSAVVLSKELLITGFAEEAEAAACVILGATDD